MGAERLRSALYNLLDFPLARAISQGFLLRVFSPRGQGRFFLPMRKIKENSAEYPVFSENFQGALSDFNPSYVEFYS